MAIRFRHAYGPTCFCPLQRCQHPVARPDVTWRSDVPSPDGNWTATAMTEGFSGSGNNYLGTTVYLRRTGAKERGYEVLGYDEDTATWERGRAPLSLDWRDPSTLRITFKQVPKQNLQVCKYGDVSISVELAR